MILSALAKAALTGGGLGLKGIVLAPMTIDEP